MSIDGGADQYERATRRLNERSARQVGMIADQLAGEGAAELGLRRTGALLDRLGQPQDAMVIVHVAGSKGKGSTTALIAAILSAAGIRTGRSTSPHLHRFTERIAIDGTDLADDGFASVSDRVLDAAQELEGERPDLGKVNAYEALFVTGLVAFRDAGCAVAVMEVGLGGRLDASNVLDPAVSVITTLDLEHTAILGPTLADIAFEKAGIIKPGRPVVVAPQPDEAMTVIRRRADQMGSHLRLVGAVEIAATPAPTHLPGDHQRINAAVAIATVAELAAADSRFTVGAPAVRAGLDRAWLPGRFEVVDPEIVSRRALRPDQLPVVVLDGGHTQRAAAAMRRLLRGDQYAGARVVAVYGVASDKDASAFLTTLGPDLVYPVAAASPRSVPAGELAALARALAIPVRETDAGSITDALHLAVAEQNAEAVVLVTGSFAVVAEARVALGLVPV